MSVADFDSEDFEFGMSLSYGDEYDDFGGEDDFDDDFDYEDDEALDDFDDDADFYDEDNVDDYDEPFDDTEPEDGYNFRTRDAEELIDEDDLLFDEDDGDLDD